MLKMFLSRNWEGDYQDFAFSSLCVANRIKNHEEKTKKLNEIKFDEA